MRIKVRASEKAHRTVKTSARKGNVTRKAARKAARRVALKKK